MKWKPVLFVSVALNLALATVYWLKSAPVAAPSPQPTSIAQTPPTESGVRVVTNLVERKIEIAGGEVHWPRWRELAVADFLEFRTNLMAIGCPGEIARDILEFSIDRQRLAERRGLSAPFNAVFWDELAKNGLRVDGGLFSEIDDQLEALDSKYDALKDAAVSGLPSGDEAESARQRANSYAHHFGHLDKTKQQQIIALDQDLQEQREKLLESGHDAKGQLRAETQQALKALETQHQETLAALMSEEERTEWRLRTRGHADWSGSLRGFEPTEEERRQVAAWKLALDEQHPRGNAKAEQQERTVAEAELNTQMQRLFGESRFHEYERANDGHFRALHDLGDRFELPGQAIEQAWQMQRDTDSAARKIRENATLTAAQRSEGLRAVQAEAQQSFQNLLGTEAFQTYRRRGGEWLKGLANGQ